MSASARKRVERGGQVGRLRTSHPSTPAGGGLAQGGAEQRVVVGDQQAGHPRER